MARQLEHPPSPFSKLLELKRSRDSQTSKQSDVETSSTAGQLNSQPPATARLAKSVDPAYTKFTTYVRKTTHRAAKLRAVEEGRELSEVVEELISHWAAERQ